MALRITNFNYSLVSQVLFSMAKMIHLVMNSWFLAVNVVMTNSCANATNSNAKATKSIAKPTNSIANRTNSTAKVTNSTANRTKSIAKVTNSIAKTCNATHHCLLSILVMKRSYIKVLFLNIRHNRR